MDTRQDTTLDESCAFGERGELVFSSCLMNNHKVLKLAMPLSRRQQGFEPPWGRQQIKQVTTCSP